MDEHKIASYRKILLSVK